MFAEDELKRSATAEEILGRFSATFLLFVGSLLAFMFVINKFAGTSDSRAFFHSNWLAVFGALFLVKGIWHWPRWRKPLGIIWLCLAGLAAFLITQSECLASLGHGPGFHTEPEVLVKIGRACIPMSLVAAAVGVSLIVWQHRRDRCPPDPDDWSYKV